MRGAIGGRGVHDLEQVHHSREPLGGPLALKILDMAALLDGASNSGWELVNVVTTWAADGSIDSRDFALLSLGRACRYRLVVATEACPSAACTRWTDPLQSSAWLDWSGQGPRRDACLA